MKKKLTLKKHTISNLKQIDFSKVYGGARPPGPPSDACNQTNEYTCGGGYWCEFTVGSCLMSCYNC